MQELLSPHFLMAIGIAILMVIMTIFIHYECLRVTSNLLQGFKMGPRSQILVAIIGIFTGHTLEVWLFAFGYYVMDAWLNMGSFTGEFVPGPRDYIYFSVVTYTSLGLGDVFPHGSIRLITGVQALVGLLMIAWSGSYTYLLMQRLWPLHIKGMKK